MTHVWQPHISAASMRLVQSEVCGVGYHQSLQLKFIYAATPLTYIRDGAGIPDGTQQTQLTS